MVVGQTEMESSSTTKVQPSKTAEFQVCRFLAAQILSSVFFLCGEFAMCQSSTHLGESPQAELLQESLESLPWRTIGPFRGGRVTAVSGCYEDRMTFYMGATGGGVWKTTDGGLNWGNLSDGFFETGSVGAIAVAPSDSNTIYVGMGECSLRGDVSHGDGFYKSIDAGKTWKKMGLGDTRHIARVVVDPQDSDLLYVAALGHLARSNEERGVFRSSDGGETWQKVLYQGPNVGAIELRMCPFDSKTLYAACWEVRRRPWGIAHGGPGSKIYKSTDGGDSWTLLSGTGGLPAGDAERIALACSPAQRGRVWALVSSQQEKGLYRTDDAGETWNLVSDHPKLFVRPFYFNHMQADSQDADCVFVMNYRLWKSTDGGSSFEKLDDFHPDHHDLWIDPHDNQRMIDGCDGGACISFNGGQTWSPAYNQPTAQIYSVTVDSKYPYTVIGPQQDWSTIGISSQGWQMGRNDRPHMEDFEVSEAGTTQVDPRDPDRAIVGDHHWLLEVDRKSGSKRFIAPSDELHYGWGNADLPHRFAWSFPVLLSQHDPDVLYVGSQFVHRSTDAGHNWEVVSPDLTLADPQTLEPTPDASGRYPRDTPSHWGPITRDSNGDQWYASVMTISESPRTPKVLWTGSDDGLIHRSEDGGESWVNVTPGDLPMHSLVSKIDASAHGEEIACFAANRYRAGDYQPYIYLTEDKGQSWKRIDQSLPREDFVRVVRCDPKNPDLIVCGTETGAYLSLDRGESWTRFEGGLPRVPVYDMLVKDGTLVVATHGRGFWIFDYLHTLQQFEPGISNERFALMKPAEVTLSLDSGTTLGRLDDVVVGYWLAEEPQSEFFMTLTDSKGRLVSQRVLRSKDGPEQERGEGRRNRDLQLGLNLCELSLTYPHEHLLPEVIIKGNVNVGPLAPPGDYQLSVHFDGDVHQKEVKVVNDPRSKASDADLNERFALGLKIRDQLSEINQGIQSLREAKEQPAFRESDQLVEIEDILVQHRVNHSKQLHAKPIKLNDKLYVLANRVAASDGAPTAAQWALYERLSGEADQALKRLRQLIGTPTRNLESSSAD